MPVRYGWRAGSRIAIDAQKAGEALAKLQKGRNDLLEPEQIVEAAKDQKSVLHGHFEWDDGVAAQAYRCDQARELVRSLTIDISRSNFEKKPVRAFLNVAIGQEQGYIQIATAMSSRELRKQVIERAFAELTAWRQRYEEITELGRIFAAIDETKKSLG